jgi:hypothetical protein
LVFEAGALSKRFEEASVCPWLVDVEFKDLTGPLARFQATKADAESTFDLVHSITARAPRPVDAASSGITQTSW